MQWQMVLHGAPTCEKYHGRCGGSGGIGKTGCGLEMNCEISSTNSGITLRCVCKLLDGRIACRESLAHAQIAGACGSDLISRAPAYTRPGFILLVRSSSSQTINLAKDNARRASTEFVCNGLVTG